LSHRGDTTQMTRIFHRDTLRLPPWVFPHRGLLSNALSLPKLLIPSCALATVSQVNPPLALQGISHIGRGRTLTRSTNPLEVSHLVNHLDSTRTPGCWVMVSPQKRCTLPHSGLPLHTRIAPCRSSSR
jgi:hypothetical protein